MPETKAAPSPRATALRPRSAFRSLTISLRYAAPALQGHIAVRLTGVAILVITASVTGKDGMHRL